MEEASDTPKPSARSDLISGAVWAVIGVAIIIGSWRMDRLAAQGVQAFAAPGLVPGILGVLITVTGLAIVLRALRQGALGAMASAEQAAAAGSRLGGRAALTLALCLGFAGLLVGHGLPFPVAAALYLFAHILLLQWHERGAAGQRGRGVLVAAAIAVVAAGVISFVFQALFLVRLP